ncbi:MAG: hypothetical protein QNJ18_11840, partial [Xenococcaceae cyanobacterium MO_167.B52]|nr:hypothetical protein [Xenococcaceae cyanobacterium MO_167.B52]
ERLTNVETKVNDIDERLTNVETKVNDIDERLTKIEQIGEKILNWSKYVFGGILLSILANILSTPLISNLFH